MRTSHFSAKRRTLGSALLAALGVVAAISMVVVLCSRVLRTDQKYVLVRQMRLEALAWCEAGLALGAHPSIQRGDPVLQWSSESGDGYSVRIISEDALLNPVAVLNRNDDQLLIDLFGSWGVELEDSMALIDAMRDWVDEDDLVSANGAEEEAYLDFGIPGLPPNRPFVEIEEMRYVRGAEVLDQVRPGWESFFSVRGSGTVDLKDASAELIAVVCAVPLERAQRFVDLRYGPDLIPDTEDDPALASLADAVVLLGPLGLPEEVVSARVSLGSSLQRVIATGRSGPVRRSLAAVVTKGRGRPTILWRGEIPADAP